MTLPAVEIVLIAPLLLATLQSVFWWRSVATALHEALARYEVFTAAFRFLATLMVAAGIITSHFLPGDVWEFGPPYRYGGILLIAATEAVQRYLRRQL